MNDLPMDVVAMYAGVVIWLVLLANDWRRQSFGVSLVFSLVLLVFLNLRYLLDGAADGIG